MPRTCLTAAPEQLLQHGVVQVARRRQAEPLQQELAEQDEGHLPRRGHTTSLLGKPSQQHGVAPISCQLGMELLPCMIREGCQPASAA